MFEIYTIKGFYDFCLEREKIRIRKTLGFPPPWTKDYILQTKKFCNLNRKHDRGFFELSYAIKESKDEKVKLLGMLFYRIFGSARSLIKPIYEIYCWEDYVEYFLSLEKFYENKIPYQLFIAEEKTWKEFFSIVLIKYNQKLFEYILSMRNETLEDSIQNVNKFFESKRRIVFGVAQWYYDLMEFFPYKVDCDRNNMIWGSGSLSALRNIGKKENLSKKELLNILSPECDNLVLEHSLCEYDKWCKKTC